MTQIRQRQVKVQVTSADPAFKVFKGIYADSGYRTLLTQNKTYDFKLNAGQTKELYIRYSQKPITITFKSNSNTSYQVTGSFGTVTVRNEDVIKTVELPTTTSDIVIAFISAISQTSMYKISSIKINRSAHTLPYSMEHVTPGTNITFEVETSLVTTTTTTTSTTTTTTTSTPAPAVLKLQSNVGGTVVQVTSDGINPEEVSLAGTTQSSVPIDMRNAPLVDA